MNKMIIVGVIVWLLFGFASVIIYCWNDLRGKEFDTILNEKYETYPSLILLGFFTFICALLDTHIVNKFFTWLVYKICNIGVKKYNHNTEE